MDDPTFIRLTQRDGQQTYYGTLEEFSRALFNFAETRIPLDGLEIALKATCPVSLKTLKADISNVDSATRLVALFVFHSLESFLSTQPLAIYPQLVSKNAKQSTKYCKLPQKELDEILERLQLAVIDYKDTRLYVGRSTLLQAVHISFVGIFDRLTLPELKRLAWDNGAVLTPYITENTNLVIVGQGETHFRHILGSYALHCHFISETEFYNLLDNVYIDKVSVSVSTISRQARAALQSLRDHKSQLAGLQKRADMDNEQDGKRKKLSLDPEIRKYTTSVNKADRRALDSFKSNSLAQAFAKQTEKYNPLPPPTWNQSLFAGDQSLMLLKSLKFYTPQFRANMKKLQEEMLVRYEHGLAMRRQMRAIRKKLQEDHTWEAFDERAQVYREERVVYLTHAEKLELRLREQWQNGKGRIALEKEKGEYALEKMQKIQVATGRDMSIVTVLSLLNADPVYERLAALYNENLKSALTLLDRKLTRIKITDSTRRKHADWVFRAMWEEDAEGAEAWLRVPYGHDCPFPVELLEYECKENPLDYVPTGKIIGEVSNDDTIIEESTTQIRGVARNVDPPRAELPNSCLPTLSSTPAPPPLFFGPLLTGAWNKYGHSSLEVHEKYLERYPEDRGKDRYDPVVKLKKQAWMAKICKLEQERAVGYHRLGYSRREINRMLQSSETMFPEEMTAADKAEAAEAARRRYDLAKKREAEMLFITNPEIDRDVVRQAVVANDELAKQQNSKEKKLVAKKKKLTDSNPKDLKIKLKLLKNQIKNVGPTEGFVDLVAGPEGIEEKQRQDQEKKAESQRKAAVTRAKNAAKKKSALKRNHATAFKVVDPMNVDGESAAPSSKTRNQSRRIQPLKGEGKAKTNYKQATVVVDAQINNKVPQVNGDDKSREDSSAKKRQKSEHLPRVAGSVTGTLSRMSLGVDTTFPEDNSSLVGMEEPRVSKRKGGPAKAKLDALRAEIGESSGRVRANEHTLSASMSEDHRPSPSPAMPPIQAQGQAQGRRKAQAQSTPISMNRGIQSRTRSERGRQLQATDDDKTIVPPVGTIIHDNEEGFGSGRPAGGLAGLEARRRQQEIASRAHLSYEYTPAPTASSTAPTTTPARVIGVGAGTGTAFTNPYSMSMVIPAIPPRPRSVSSSRHCSTATVTRATYKAAQAAEQQQQQTQQQTQQQRSESQTHTQAPPPPPAANIADQFAYLSKASEKENKKTKKESSKEGKKS